VITEATLRLRALPQTDMTVGVALSSDARALEGALTAIRALPLAAWALEVLSTPLAVQLGIGDSPVLLARLAGNEALVAAQLASLGALGDTTPIDSDVWSRLRAAEPPDGALVRLSCLPASLPRVASSLLAPGVLPAGSLASATLSRGLLRCVIPSDALPNAPAALLGAPDVGGVRLSRIWQRLPAHRWSEIAPSVVRDRLSLRVREAFDPAMVLNRGIMGELA
jgi:hypothetical protein